jgi:hypothetical protein
MAGCPRRRPIPRRARLLLVVVDATARLRVLDLPKNLIRETVQSKYVVAEFVPLPGVLQLVSELRRCQGKLDWVDARGPPNSDAVASDAAWAVRPF